MKKGASFSKFLLINFFVLLFQFVIGCTSLQSDASNDIENYKIATPDYIVLSEKSLDLLASFELDSFASMLSDDVEYEFPNGKKLVGKIALINYWKNYKNTSGIKSMKIINANYLPVDTHIKPKGDETQGIKVGADFTNNMIFDRMDISVKMNFNFHFNDKKMINRIMTYYDQTLITNASKVDVLQKTGM